MTQAMRAVVLLSGGMDSATALYRAGEDGCTLYALTFEYGQRHRRELSAARALGRVAGVRDHRILRIPLGSFGGSALTDRRQKVPRNRKAHDIGGDIPSTYVPARNTVLLAFALAYAEVVRAERVYIGANAVDYSGYPDCRPEFFAAFQRLANLATKRGVTGHGLRVMTPLLHLSKAGIVREALRLKVPLHLTWSCYLGGRVACGTCDSCRLRLKGFREAGAVDPIAYVKRPQRRATRRLK